MTRVLSRQPSRNKNPQDLLRFKRRAAHRPPSHTKRREGNHFPVFIVSIADRFPFYVLAFVKFLTHTHTHVCASFDTRLWQLHFDMGIRILGEYVTVPQDRLLPRTTFTQKFPLSFHPLPIIWNTNRRASTKNKKYRDSFKSKRGPFQRSPTGHLR